MHVESCDFVEACDLVPREWDNWFWGAISENAPFSWGDNNRSLVCACDFLDHCKNRIDPADYPCCTEDFERFCERVESLGSLYIDLEN